MSTDLGLRVEWFSWFWASEAEKYIVAQKPPNPKLPAPNPQPQTPNSQYFTPLLFLQVTKSGRGGGGGEGGEGRGEGWAQLGPVVSLLPGPGDGHRDGLLGLLGGRFLGSQGFLCSEVLVFKGSSLCNLGVGRVTKSIPLWSMCNYTLISPQKQGRSRILFKGGVLFWGFLQRF